MSSTRSGLDETLRRSFGSITGRETYLDSFVRFARAHVAAPDPFQALECAGGGYKTTEGEVLRSLPSFEAPISREQGLGLVQRSCRQLREQVLSLRRRHHGARHDGGYERRVPEVRERPVLVLEKPRAVPKQGTDFSNGGER